MRHPPILEKKTIVEIEPNLLYSEFSILKTRIDNMEEKIADLDWLLKSVISDMRTLINREESLK